MHYDRPQLSQIAFSEAGRIKGAYIFNHPDHLFNTKNKHIVVS